MQNNKVILLILFFICVVIIIIVVWKSNQKKLENDVALGKWSNCTREMSKSSSLINGFCQQHAFLSNFFPLPVTRNGKTYSSSEVAYQAAKFDDNPTVQDKFLNVNADESKKLASSNKYDAVKFSKRRITVMREILMEKFKNETLKRQLLETGTATLVEYNWWGDQFWGKTRQGGENQLGLLLMKIRKEINES